MCNDSYEEGRCSHCGWIFDEEDSRCSHCGWIFDEEDNCNCPPEGYMNPGSEAFLYVNAYEVSRSYGGPEEGGWWFDVFNPLASIPVLADVVEGHDNSCYTCYCAREYAIEVGEGLKPHFCKWSYQIIAKDEAQVEMFKKHLEECYGKLREGSIYSVLGGTDIQICVEKHPAEKYPLQKPHYE
ncbi:MAG TPA: hypothetical protein PLE74_07675 [Candidatus Cloacimonadota bacterium]|nr:hypothetical protein [Candidatus Cloacimonadota bacterium]